MSEKRKDWKEQVNWLIAPPDTTHFAIDQNGDGWFLMQFSKNGPRAETHLFGDDFAWGNCNKECGFGSWHNFDYGDWRETLIERPAEAEQERPFEVGDVVINTKGKFIGHILSVSNFEFTIYSEQYTEILREKGYILNEGNIYTFLKDSIEHAPKDRAIAYQNATVNDALIDPDDVVGEYIIKMHEQLGLNPDTKYSFARQDEGENIDGILGIIAKYEEAGRNRQRWQMQRDVFVALCANPNVETNILKSDVANEASYLVDAFFEKFGYSM